MTLPAKRWPTHFGALVRQSHLRNCLFLFSVCVSMAFMCPITHVQAQCSDGHVEVEVVVSTDSWGYEVYWELTPAGTPCGSPDFFGVGGNPEVGCDGLGISNGGSTYENNATYVEGPFCVPYGMELDLIHVDSYGDGGTQFELNMDGTYSGIFNGTGYGNVWSFAAGECLPMGDVINCNTASLDSVLEASQELISGGYLNGVVNTCIEGTNFCPVDSAYVMELCRPRPLVCQQRWLFMRRRSPKSPLTLPLVFQQDWLMMLKYFMVKILQ